MKVRHLVFSIFSLLALLVSSCGHKSIAERNIAYDSEMAESPEYPGSDVINDYINHEFISQGCYYKKLGDGPQMVFGKPEAEMKNLNGKKHKFVLNEGKLLNMGFFNVGRINGSFSASRIGKTDGVILSQGKNYWEIKNIMTPAFSEEKEETTFRFQNDNLSIKTVFMSSKKDGAEAFCKFVRAD